MGVGVGVGLQAPSALGSQGVGCGDGWRVAQSSLGFREGDEVGSRVSSPPPSVVGAGVGLQPSLPFGSQGVGQGVSMTSWGLGDGLSVGIGVGFGVSSLYDGLRLGAGLGFAVS